MVKLDVTFGCGCGKPRQTTTIPPTPPSK